MGPITALSCTPMRKHHCRRVARIMQPDVPNLGACQHHGSDKGRNGWPEGGSVVASIVASGGERLCDRLPAHGVESNVVRTQVERCRESHLKV